MIKKLLDYKNKFTSFVLAAIAVFGFCGTAHAAQDLDVGAMQLNVLYSFNENYQFGNFYGTYTAPVDMTIRVTFDSNTKHVDCFSDPSYTKMIGSEFSAVADFYTVDLKENQTVYFYGQSLFDPFTIMLTNNDETEVVLNWVNVENGSDFSLGSNANVEFTFTGTVSCSGATLTSGDNVANLSVISFNDGLVLRVYVKPTLNQWYANGTLKAGDELTVTLNDVKSKDSGKVVGSQGGKISVTYKMMAAPIKMVSISNVPPQVSDFLSFYLPTNEQRLIKVEFSGELLPVEDYKHPIVELGIGNLEGVPYYRETIVPTIENGNTLVIDLGGQVRSYATMFGDQLTSAMKEQSDFKLMNMFLNNIQGADGQFVATEGDSNLGSFGYQFNYVDVTFTLAVDPNPVRGSKLSEGQEIELFVIGLDKVDYSGMSITYETADGENTVLVPVSAISVKDDEIDPRGKVMTFNMPKLEGVKEGGVISISFADLLCADGLDHNISINYVAGDFSGVSGIGDTEESFTVYSVDGVKVMKNAAAYELNELPAGLYIVNGKKYIIK